MIYFGIKNRVTHNSVTFSIPGFKNRCQTAVIYLLYLKSLATLTQYVEQFVECLFSGVRFLASNVWKMSLPDFQKWVMVHPVSQAKVPAVYVIIQRRSKRGSEKMLCRIVRLQWNVLTQCQNINCASWQTKKIVIFRTSQKIPAFWNKCPFKIAAPYQGKPWFGELYPNSFRVKYALRICIWTGKMHKNSCD